MNVTLSQAKLINPVPSGLNCDHDSLLGSVLNQLDQTDVKLVYDSNNQFIGLLSSRRSIYKNSYPMSTKVGRTTFMPQKFELKSSLLEVAGYLAAERIDLVPVWKGQAISGVVWAHDIVEYISQNPSLLTEVAQKIELDEVVTHQLDGSINDIYQNIKDRDLIVIIDALGKMVGAVTAADVQQAFIIPTAKQRFGKNQNRSTDWAFDGEKVKRLDDPIKNYLTPEFPVASADQSPVELIMQLLTVEPKILVLQDLASRPVGSLSLRNVLMAFSKLAEQPSVNIIIQKPSANVSENDFQDSLQQLEVFSQKMNKRVPLDKIEVKINETISPSRKTASYNTTLIMVPNGSGQYVAQTKASSYNQSLKSAMKQIAKQFRRTHQAV